MPFKSRAQRRKFAELLVKGEISPETYEEWNRETGKAKLPERVTPKKPTKPTKPRRPARKKTPAKPRKKPARKRKPDSLRRSRRGSA
jgi:hypothetical protein